MAGLKDLLDRHFSLANEDSDEIARAGVARTFGGAATG